MAAALALLVACGSSDERPTQTVFGDERPVELRVPGDYDHRVPAPLLLVLHGYGINGAVELVYTRLSEVVDQYGVLVLAPDGTLDLEGNLFWHTEHVDCRIGEGVPLADDIGYLIGLIDDVSAVWNVDPARVYVFGHSNGGFMAHRLACNYADRIAAIVSLAGAPALDAADCVPSVPVSMLQIHGDDDDVVLYDGGQQIVGATCPYPGAAVVASRWAGHNGCSATLEPAGARLDLDSSLDGEETRVERHADCVTAAVVELWTIEGGGHVPVFRNDVHQHLWGFFAAHPK